MMLAALQVEGRKLRRSRVVLVASVLQVVLVPLLSLLMVRAAGSGVGVLAGKGELLVSGEGWQGYLGVVGQVAAAALFVGAGVVIAWVFGREHAEGTFGALFSLPVSRGHVAAAKLAAVVVWVVAVGVGIVAATAVLGAVAGVDPAATRPPGGGVLRLLRHLHDAAERAGRTGRQRRTWLPPCHRGSGRGARERPGVGVPRRRCLVPVRRPGPAGRGRRHDQCLVPDRSHSPCSPSCSVPRRRWCGGDGRRWSDRCLPGLWRSVGGVRILPSRSGLGRDVRWVARVAKGNAL